LAALQDRRSSERVRFQTATGSIYVVERSGDAMSWRRESVTFASGRLRSDKGVLLEWPDIAIGQSCLLLTEPINPPWTRRVRTSPIVKILEAMPGGPAGVKA
jgi:hypothetical protein